MALALGTTTSDTFSSATTSTSPGTSTSSDGGGSGFLRPWSLVQLLAGWRLRRSHAHL
jgi:hypothetical protein